MASSTSTRVSWPVLAWASDEVPRSRVRALGLPVFFYLWVLYMARIQYRIWVRREGAVWRANGRS